jgi:hypothetical protein
MSAMESVSSSSSGSSQMNDYDNVSNDRFLNFIANKRDQNVEISMYEFI